MATKTKRKKSTAKRSKTPKTKTCSITKVCTASGSGLKMFGSSKAGRTLSSTCKKEKSARIAKGCRK